MATNSGHGHKCIGEIPIIIGSAIWWGSLSSIYFTVQA